MNHRRSQIITLTISALLLLTAGAVIALEVREVVTSLKTGNVRISSGSDSEKVTLDSPVDFAHMGHNLKGDSGSLTLRKLPDGSRAPVLLNLNGRIEYSDDRGYSGGCRGGGHFDFIAETALLRTSAWIKSDGFFLEADRLNYNSDKILFEAIGNVVHRGQIDKLPFDVTKNVGEELQTENEYVLNCENILYDGMHEKVEADGSVNLKFGTSSFESDSVNLTFTGDEIKSIAAEGNVHFLSPDIEGSGPRMIYSETKQELIFGSTSRSEKVKVTYKGQKLQGTQVVIFFGDNERVEILDSVININLDTSI